MKAPHRNPAVSQLAEDRTRIAQLEAKLSTYEAWFAAIDRHADFDLWFKDKDGRYQFVNRRFEEVIGRRREQLNGKLPKELFGAERAARIEAMDRSVMRDGCVERVVPCDETGVLEIHHEKRFPVTGPDGEVIGLGCFAFEVTEKSIVTDQLAQAQKIAKLGSWRWSVRDGVLISCSDEFAAILGCSVKEAFHLMHDRINRIVHPDDRAMVADLVGCLGGPGCKNYEIEYRIVRPSGEVRHVQEIAEPLYGNSGQPVEYTGTLQDITERKRAEEELRAAKDNLERRVIERTRDLEYLVSFDQLTGLMNRRSFHQTIFDRKLQGEACAVVLLDLDGFKAVNDSFGHSIGDELLKIIARRIRAAAGSTAIAARLGSDEFAVGLFDGDIANAEDICGQLRTSIASTIAIGSLQLHVGCCCGISHTGADRTAEEAIQFADIALNRAKQMEGEACVTFEPRMAEELAMKKRLENDLRLALTRGDLYLAYQPQVDLKRQQVAGLEALVRWTHPELGNIPPGTFVPIAEECGLINDLGAFVLERSCSELVHLAHWSGRGMRIGVNLSASQFYNPMLGQQIIGTLDRRHVNPERVEIEVTESLFIRNKDLARSALDRFRAIGMKVALDDFGTGFSALGYLKEFQIDRVKLDRSFIKDVATSESDQRIVRGIVNLAKSLGIEVIAEGVEDPEQIAFLQMIGCDEVQGFYYGRPMVADDLMPYLLRKLSSGSVPQEERQLSMFDLAS